MFGSWECKDAEGWNIVYAEEIVREIKQHSGQYTFNKGIFKMIKILVVNTVFFRKNGISNVIMNYYKNMDLVQFQMDFVINREIDTDYQSYMIEKGANVFILNRNRNHCLLLWLK